MADISSIKLPDNSIHNIKSKKIFYAECATARNVIAKVINCEGFVLETGAIIAVRFTDTSSTSPKSGKITLNINNTGAKNIIPKSNNAVYTYNRAWAFCNNQTWLFVYNGTYFVCINQDNDTTCTPMSLGFGYGTCSTVEATTAKVAVLTSYVLVKNSMVSVKFSYAVPANSTLNINSKGAKNIFYRGTKITAGIINAGDIATFVYDGTQYQLISVDANYARKTDLPAIDTALSATSTNPVQNKVINTALSGKANSSHTHSKSDITDFPSALPANGGNADSVDGLHASDFIRRYGSAKLSAEYVSEAVMDTDYKGVIDGDVANNIGLDGSNSCWWHIIGLKNFNDDGYGTQIAIPLYPTTSLQKPKYRTSAGTVFQSWQNFADGGNADTVGGKSPSDFLPFQAYAPIYTGDIKDISKMGTYSCYKGNCTNLPDIRIWAYVIMISFRDAGYKTFLCIEFNPSPSTQHCRNIYIAREYDVDSSGNMIWYRACDGGNADTVGGVGITNLRQITQTVINTLPTVPNGEGDFLVNCDASDTSFPYWYGHLSIRYGSYTGEYVAIFRTTGNDNKVYYNTYLTNHWHGWINVADGGNAATVNGRPAFRIPTLDGSGNLWDTSNPNINDLYAQWDASKQYFKLKTFGGNNVAVDIATSNIDSGTITGLSNGAAKTIPLPFSPVFVLFHSNGHVVQGGFALSCGTNSFTITPANVSTMGSTAVGYIAFGR